MKSIGFYIAIYSDMPTAKLKELENNVSNTIAKRAIGRILMLRN